LTSVWLDYEDQQLLNQSDRDTQLQRLIEGQGNINCPVAWFRFCLALHAKAASPPTILEHKNIVNQIITLANFNFNVDRAWISTKNDVVTNKTNEYFLTYVAICPSKPANTTHSNLSSADKLITVEETLFQLFLNSSNLSTTDHMAIINHCHFQLPPVNNNQEHLAFIIKGLNPSIILPNREEEIATQRELAAKIFRSFKQLHNLTFRHQQLPASINNIQDNLPFHMYPLSRVTFAPKPDNQHNQ
jgi:hypothetical protein